MYKIAPRTNPRHGLVAPNDFIPLLEETGLIDDVGLWVLRQACQDMLRLAAELGQAPRVSVNLSARQFSSQRLAEQVAAMHAQALREEGVQRHRGLLEAVDGNPRRRVRPPWCLRRPS